MSFWTDQTNIVDPKRAYSFWVHFGKLDGSNSGLPHWAVKSTTKPKFTINSVEHKYLNHTFYYPGTVKWEEVEMKLVDPTSPDASHALAKAIEDSGYHLPSMSGDGPTTISKEGAVNVFGQVRISQYDGAGNTVEEWTLHNAFLTNVDFGDLKYDGDGDLVELSVKFRYDWATLDRAAGSNAPVQFSPR